MGISTYSELKASILAFLGRPNDPLIPTGDLISLFESDANRKLRTSHQETSTTINVLGGTDTYSLPNDFLAPREVRITSSTPIAVLEYMSPSQLDDMWWSCNQQWQPANYTIEGGNIRFGPIPNAEYTVKLSYYAKIPPLADDSDSATALSIVDPGTGYGVNDILIVSGGVPNDPVTLIAVDTVSVIDEFSATALAIADGGTGYTAGDILVVAGGTASTPAELNAVTVNSVTGAVLTASIRTPGDYSVTPANDAETTGGSGFGAAFTITWTQNGATGEIQTASIIEAGDYATPPSNPVEVTGGSGDGTATFNLTYTANGGNTNWLLQSHSDLYLYGSLAEAELFLGADNSTVRFQLFMARRDDYYQQIITAERKRVGSPLHMRPDGATP